MSTKKKWRLIFFTTIFSRPRESDNLDYDRHESITKCLVYILETFEFPDLGVYYAIYICIHFMKISKFFVKFVFQARISFFWTVLK